MLACVEDIVINIATFTLADYGAHLNDLRACAEYYCDLHFFGSDIVSLEMILVIICESLYKFLDRCRCGGLYS